MEGRKEENRADPVRVKTGDQPPTFIESTVLQEMVCHHQPATQQPEKKTNLDQPLEGEGRRGREREREREREISLAINCHLIFHPAQCSIQYENIAINYGRMALLQCPLSAPVNWWRSTEQCGSFIDYTRSECSTTLCHVHINSSYFYYCCTASTVSDVLLAGDEEKSCFRIQGQLL